ncbi:cbb3-type cytochrome c oxidase subunit 3 [Roseivivax sp. GX 12232]|uniref:cbb3-type cytochrome c oxidase subunit 3 n=1 Tax=Roseivivax sp. GX 12232 TaxID=2900547 RepID=UPI001E31C60A|nr:cbb3-type cytochrome c oxidase subunit 3 [Roseivivax sp. GX 12232]MCE0504034.1 cbb3-type cytochrome c oxidase subunit 3 [Roseivivax sp. GX 12232]
MQDTYSLLRAFADSWALLALFLFFLGAFLWVWRPGSRALHDDAARSIFRDAPPPAPERPRAGCGRACAGCTCAPEESRQ